MRTKRFDKIKIYLVVGRLRTRNGEEEKKL